MTTLFRKLATNQIESRLKKPFKRSTVTQGNHRKRGIRDWPNKVNDPATGNARICDATTTLVHITHYTSPNCTEVYTVYTAIIAKPPQWPYIKRISRNNLFAQGNEFRVRHIFSPYSNRIFGFFGFIIWLLLLAQYVVFLTLFHCQLLHRTEDVLNTKLVSLCK